MLNENDKRIIDCTLDEVADRVYKKLNEKYTPELVSGDDLSKKTGYSIGRLREFKNMGMPKYGHDKWDYKACEKWILEELPKILKYKKHK